MAENKLFQLNAIPTCNSRILDLVCSNTPSITVQSSQSVIQSDHLALEINLSCLLASRVIRPDKVCYNFKRADFDHLKAQLSSLPWNMLNSYANVDDAVELFYDFLNAAINDSVPKVRLKRKRFPIWYSTDLICLQKEKEQARILFKRTRCPTAYKSFSTIGSEFKKAQRQTYLDYLKTIEISISSNCKRFWSFVKSKCDSRSTPSVITHDNYAADTPLEVAELFNKYFKSVYQLDEDNITYPTCKDFCDRTMNTLSVSIEQVCTILQNTDTSTASGPDNIPATILSKCATELSVPLTIIFNLSLSSGQFPTFLKRANIVPVFKSGDRNLAKNYRPISLLPLIGKVFEKAILSHISFHLKGTISNFQHGFVSGRSTATNLVNYIDYITAQIDSGNQVDSIYLDFSKAFDSVSHSLLIYKLQYYGICGKLKSWFHSYLSNRLQRVVIGGHQSSWGAVSSGVPQGSLLGPVLFIMYINDMSNCILTSNISLYADDSKVFNKILRVNDCNCLQADLDRCALWCHDWKLKINLGKCDVITFSNKKNVVVHKYYLNGDIINRVNVIKDLGVTLTHNLNFNTHINNIVAKAFKMLGFLKRTCNHIDDVAVLKSLYVSLVRSNLEYCSQVWSPSQKYLIAKVERVQYKFLKYLCFKCNVPYRSSEYASMCKYFNLPSLEARRSVLDLCFLHKCLNATYCNAFIVSEIPFYYPVRFTRSQDYFRPSICRINLRKFSYLPRTYNLFNNIFRKCNDIDIFSSFFKFKTILSNLFYS